MAEHTDKYFSGASEKNSSLAALIGRHYEFALLGSSWDSRCLSICEVERISIEQTILFLPDERDDLGLRDNHDEKLKEFIFNHSTVTHLLTGGVKSPEIVWDNIYDLMIGSGKITFPVESALVDLSTMCRYFSLGVVAMLLRLGLARRVDVIYSECIYLASSDDAVEFTEGVWERRAIPFLDGDCNPAAPEYWLLSAGFEGLKTRRFVHRDEPDRIQILLPDPGFNDFYEVHSLTEAMPLIKEFGLSESDICKAHAGDAIEAWKAIHHLNLDKIQNMQLSYICGGTKPHSLGLALQALASRRPVVHYIRPDSYRVVETRPTGVHWRYTIEDLSHIPL